MSAQLDNGYTKIANEIMDALCMSRIPGEQRQCLDFIIRKTYGFNKKEDIISNGQFCKATGLKKPSVCRAINGLIAKNIVTKKANNTIPSYRFNKNYKKWVLLAKKITVSEKVIQGVTKKLPTKESITKEKEPFTSDSDEIRLSILLFQRIKDRNPEHKNPDIQKWAKNIDYMIRLDKRDPQKIANVIGWCQDDGPTSRWSGWQNNILSTASLREQYDKLVLEMNARKISQPKRVNTAADTTAMLDELEGRR